MTRTTSDWLIDVLHGLGCNGMSHLNLLTCIYRQEPADMVNEQCLSLIQYSEASKEIANDIVYSFMLSSVIIV